MGQNPIWGQNFSKISLPKLFPHHPKMTDEKKISYLNFIPQRILVLLFQRDSSTLLELESSAKYLRLLTILSVMKTLCQQEPNIPCQFPPPIELKWKSDISRLSFVCDCDPAPSPLLGVTSPIHRFFL